MLFLPALFGAITQPQDDAGKIKWFTDYNKGLETAKKACKPVLIYFGAID